MTILNLDFRSEPQFRPLFCAIRPIYGTRNVTNKVRIRSILERRVLRAADKIAEINGGLVVEEEAAGFKKSKISMYLCSAKRSGENQAK